MAGFFDGEGSINITKRMRKHWNPEYTLNIAIGQKDGKTLDWVKDNFGGNVYLVKRDGSFFWAISNRNAYKVLKILLPYLQYKKPQAELVLGFYDGCLSRKRPIPKDELSRRETIRQELIQLHKTIIKSQYVGSTTKRVNPKGM
jgi:hypothetical protein